MAQDVRNVQVDLTANVSAYQRAMQDAAKATNVTLGAVTSLARATDNLVKSAGKKMIFLGASDIAALTAAAETANRFNVAMTEVRSNSAITGQSVAALRTQVISLSKSIPDSTNNIARLVGQIQSLGVQGTQNIRNLTETAERLAAATNTAPGQLFTQLFQLNRQMGNGLQTINNYASAVVGLSKQTGTSADQITGFATSIASVAQSAGYSETQILGLAAAFSRVGADSAGAANVFTTITSEINQAVVTNSGALKQFAQIIGTTTDSFRKMAQQNPAQALVSVLNAIQGQGKAGILTLQQLGLDGPRALRVITALTGGQANLAQTLGMASQAYAKNQDLTKSSNAAWDNLSSTMQKLRNNLTDIALTFGGPMEHALNLMFKSLNMVLGPINTFLGMLGPIPGIVAGIGGAFLAVTGTITAFSIAILAAAGAWRALSGMTGTNALQGLVSGVRQPTGQGAFVNPRTIFRQKPISTLDLTREEALAAGLSPREYRSSSARRIFGGAYGLGQRFSAPPPEDPTLAQRFIARTGSIGRSIATYPVRRLGFEIKEAGDTLKPRNLFNYENRDNSKVNPYSLLGFMQASQRVGSSAHGTVQDISGRLSGLLGGTKFGQTPPLVVNADTKEALAKIEAVRKTASAPVSIPLAVGGVGGVGRAAGAAEEELGKTGGALSMLGRGVGGAVNAMGTMASAVSSVALPLAVLAPAGFALYHVFNSLHSSAEKAAENLSDLGTQLAQTAGVNYTKPTYTPPSTGDTGTPFGVSQRNIASSSTFRSGNASDIARLGSYKDQASRKLATQLLVNNVVQNANSGTGLGAAETQTLQEDLIAAYGQQAGKTIFNRLNLKGTNSGSSLGKLLSGVRDDSGFFQAPFQGKNSSAQIANVSEVFANAVNSGNYSVAAQGFASLGKNLTGLATPAQANTFRNASQNPDDVPTGQNVMFGPNTHRLQNFVGQLLTQLNKNQSHDQQIRGIHSGDIYNIQDFMTALRNSGERGKELAQGLADAGLQVGAFGVSLDAAKNANNANTSEIVRRENLVAKTTIGRQALNAGIDLGNTQNADFPSQIQFLTGVNQQVRGGSPLVTNQEAIQKSINAWMQYATTISTSSAQFQAVTGEIDSLNQALQAQQSIFETAGQQAQYYAGQAGEMISKFGTTGFAGQQEKGYLAQAQQYTDQGISTLKGYVMQVHQAHIQMQQGEQDFNLQMTHMYRDFNIQQKEAFYQRNVQVKEQNYEFNDQLRSMRFQTANVFGNGAAMVNSQYTMGAQTSLYGIRQQNQLIEGTKNTIDQLSKLGVSRGVIRILGLDDPNNEQQAERYLTNFAQNPKLVNAFNKSIKNRLKISQGLDTDVNNSKFQDMQRSFNHSAKIATEAFNHSQQITKAAFDTSLSDFTQQYQISVEREQQQLSEIGQNLYTSWASLDKAAMRTGLQNIQDYARGVGKALHQLAHENQHYINSYANTNNLGSPGVNLAGGISGGGAVGNAPVTGQSATGGGLPGQAGGGSKGGGSGSTRTGYVRPGTGAVYDRGTGPTGRNSNGTTRYVPSTKFIAGHPANAGFNQSIARSMAPDWAKGTMWQDWVNLWNQESGWNQYAQNNTSSAYGIPQALPGSKMSTAGGDWRTNPATQIRWGINYIKTHIDDDGRPYGNPARAWAHEQRHNWYAAGGIATRPHIGVVAEGGSPEAMIPLNKQGATFMAQVIDQSLARTGLASHTMSMMRTASHAAPVINVGSISNTVDNSNTFMGQWHIEASDPDSLMKKIQAQQRYAALTKPRARR